MATRLMDPIFFETPQELRAWLEQNHDKEKELLVGFHKKSTGRPSITWPELVDEILCFGWIDGIRRGIDDERYTIRITPRKATSNWSAVNIKRVAELEKEGRMTSAGRAAFERRSEGRSGIYSYEQRKNANLDREQEREFKANPEAWAFFQSQAPSYRRTAVYWVTTAKREETRRKRLAQLVEDSASGRRLRHLTPPSRRA